MHIGRYFLIFKIKTFAFKLFFGVFAIHFLVLWHSPILSHAASTENSITIYQGDPIDYDFSSADIDLIHAIVMAEAEAEPYEGKLAVAQIILYRAKKNECSIPDVIYAKNQFSVVGTDRMYIEPDEDCIEAVQDAIDGYYVLDPEVEYFCSGYSSWHERSLTSVGSIGNHHFYKY